MASREFRTPLPEADVPARATAPPRIAAARARPPQAIEEKSWLDTAADWVADTAVGTADSVATAGRVVDLLWSSDLDMSELKDGRLQATGMDLEKASRLLPESVSSMFELDPEADSRSADVSVDYVEGTITVRAAELDLLGFDVGLITGGASSMTDVEVVITDLNGDLTLDSDNFADLSDFDIQVTVGGADVTDLVVTHGESETHVASMDSTNLELGVNQTPDGLISTLSAETLSGKNATGAVTASELGISDLGASMVGLGEEVAVGFEHGSLTGAEVGAGSPERVEQLDVHGFEGFRNEHAFRATAESATATGVTGTLSAEGAALQDGRFHHAIERNTSTLGATRLTAIGVDGPVSAGGVDLQGLNSTIDHGRSDISMSLDRGEVTNAGIGANSFAHLETEGVSGFWNEDTLHGKVSSATVQAFDGPISADLAQLQGAVINAPTGGEARIDLASLRAQGVVVGEGESGPPTFAFSDIAGAGVAFSQNEDGQRVTADTASVSSVVSGSMSLGAADAEKASFQNEPGLMDVGAETLRVADFDHDAVSMGAAAFADPRFFVMPERMYGSVTSAELTGLDAGGVRAASVTLNNGVLDRDRSTGDTMGTVTSADATGLSVGALSASEIDIARAGLSLGTDGMGFHAGEADVAGPAFGNHRARTASLSEVGYERRWDDSHADKTTIGTASAAGVNIHGGPTADGVDLAGLELDRASSGTDLSMASLNATGFAMHTDGSSSGAGLDVDRLVNSALGLIDDVDMRASANLYPQRFGSGLAQVGVLPGTTVGGHLRMNDGAIAPGTSAYLSNPLDGPLWTRIQGARVDEQNHLRMVMGDGTAFDTTGRLNAAMGLPGSGLHSPTHYLNAATAATSGNDPSAPPLFDPASLLLQGGVGLHPGPLDAGAFDANLDRSTNVRVHSEARTHVATAGRVDLSDVDASMPGLDASIDAATLRNLGVWSARQGSALSTQAGSLALRGVDVSQN